MPHMKTHLEEGRKREELGPHLFARPGNWLDRTQDPTFCSSMVCLWSVLLSSVVRGDTLDKVEPPHSCASGREAMRWRVALWSVLVAWGPAHFPLCPPVHAGKRKGERKVGDSEKLSQLPWQFIQCLSSVRESVHSLRSWIDCRTCLLRGRF